MNATPQELLKEYVQSQHFTSTAEIMTAMKEMFRYVVQTVVEVEMDEELGRERCQRSEASSFPNIKVPLDGSGSFEPKMEIQQECGRDGGEDSGIVLLLDEPAGHRGSDQRII